MWYYSKVSPKTKLSLLSYLFIEKRKKARERDSACVHIYVDELIAIGAHISYPIEDVLRTVNVRPVCQYLGSGEEMLSVREAMTKKNRHQPKYLIAKMYFVCVSRICNWS